MTPSAANAISGNPSTTYTIPLLPTSVAFVTKLSSISFSDFRKYYVKKHIPYFISLINGKEFIQEYRLYFPPRGQQSESHGDSDHSLVTTPPSGSPEKWHYDAMVTVTYKSANAMEEIVKKYVEFYKDISEDEARFLEAGAVRSFVVGAGAGNGAWQAGDGVEFVMS